MFEDAYLAEIFRRLGGDLLRFGIYIVTGPID